MSYNSVNQTTGELTRIAGLFKSETLNEISAAFPDSASSSNKLATMADTGISNTDWATIENLI